MRHLRTTILAAIVALAGCVQPDSPEQQIRAVIEQMGREAEAGAAWNLAADLCELNIALIREGDDWKVTYAEWVRR